MMGGGGRRGKGMMGGMSAAAAAEGHLAALKYELKITPKQEDAWNTFAKAVRENAKDKEEAMKESGMPRRAAMQTNGANRTLPDEIAAREKMMKAAMGRLEKYKKAVDPLYKSLSDEQKKTADRHMITGMGMCL
jgi:hypothetical protein